MAAGPPLPPKRDVALALLKGTDSPTMFVHLDPRKKGVIVPRNFAVQHQLILQVGMNMAVPIPDLDIGEDGIGCTLSFSQRAFWCFLPWHAVYALVGEDSRGMVWPDDVPPEVAGQRQKPKLSVVGGKAGKAQETPAKESEPEDEQPRRPRGRLAVATAAAMQMPPDDFDEPEQPRRGAHLSVVPAGDEPDAAGHDAEHDGAAADEPGADKPAADKPAAAPTLTAVPKPDKPSKPSPDGEPEPDGDGPGSGGPLPPYLRVVK